MRILFCADPLGHDQVDPAYERERAAAAALGLGCDLVDYDALVEAGVPRRAVRRVAEPPAACLGIYRGWMLRPEHYAQLYHACNERGVHLINDPGAYRHCHYLPESYAVIEPWTPRSVWLPTGPDVSMDRVMGLLAPFGSSPVVLKDFVKSRKHEWAEACYIPSAADRTAVERAVRRFLDLQGPDLNEGLVFREFVEFEPLGIHPKSGMPLIREFRIFFLDGEPIYSTPYWEGQDYSGASPPVDRFRDVAARVRSRFFAMDVARRRDGDWMIVELGDGQVAGLPEHADARAFFSALRLAARE